MSGSDKVTLSSLPDDGLAIVIGASGGIGEALAFKLVESRRFEAVFAISRRSRPSIDLCDEDSIRCAAAELARGGEIRLVIVATGLLHKTGMDPEKTWGALDPVNMAESFAINAIGPALLMKHFLPLLPKTGKSIFAVLSAKVGSIGDNRLGGWYSYRASKAALNQLVRTAAIELKRNRPEAICAAIHPGTVATSLSAPFARTGLTLQSPAQSAAAIVACLDGLGFDSSGGFFDRTGSALPW